MNTEREQRPPKKVLDFIYDCQDDKNKSISTVTTMCAKQAAWMAMEIADAKYREVYREKVLNAFRISQCWNNCYQYTDYKTCDLDCFKIKKFIELLDNDKKE